jgi:hypothetical protein
VLYGLDTILMMLHFSLQSSLLRFTRSKILIGLILTAFNYKCNIVQTSGALLPKRRHGVKRLYLWYVALQYKKVFSGSWCSYLVLRVELLLYQLLCTRNIKSDYGYQLITKVDQFAQLTQKQLKMWKSTKMST